MTGKPQLLGVHNAMDSIDAARQSWERWFLLSLCSKCCVSSCISFIMGCMYICYIYIYIYCYIISFIYSLIHIYNHCISKMPSYTIHQYIYICMYVLFHHAAMRLEESEHQELLRSERVLSALRQAQQSLQKRQERLELVVGLMG